jgi:hypothetical protein
MGLRRYRDSVSDAREGLRSGAELWNRGLYWEAHEAWEGPWRAAGRHSPAGRFFQGLILLAAAALEHQRGAPATARRLAARGARALAGAQPGPPPFDAPAFAAAVVAWLAGERSAPPLLDTFSPSEPLLPRSSRASCSACGSVEPPAPSSPPARPAPLAPSG